MVFALFLYTPVWMLVQGLALEMEVGKAYVSQYLDLDEVN